MGNSKMSEKLPDTLTPLSIPEEQREINLPWGRLYSCLRNFKSVDLVEETITMGRDESCTIIVSQANFPSNMVIVISKVHFTLTKDDYNNLICLKDESKNGTFINNVLVGRGKTNILEHNDVLSVGFKGYQKLFIFKMLDEDKSSLYLPPILKKKYKLSRFLGRGACGEVHLLFEKSTTKPFAVKKIKKGSYSTSDDHQLNHPINIMNEMRILSLISHPCIIGMREIVETDTDVFIILEYMGGGELTSRILSIQSMSEQNIKFIFYQIALAVRYLHRNGITHRDLKPDNVLLATDAEETLVKITDFGLSKILDNFSMMETVCGTPTYVAPEIVDQKYSEYDNKVDIWSLGVILYYMLAKELPFKSTDRATLNMLIIKGQYTFESPKWSNVSDLVKDLIKHMLVVDPLKRYSIDQVLNHSWLSQDKQTHKKLSQMINADGDEYISSSDSDSEDDSCEPPIKMIKLTETAL